MDLAKHLQTGTTAGFSDMKSMNSALMSRGRRGAQLIDTRAAQQDDVFSSNQIIYPQEFPEFSKRTMTKFNPIWKRLWVGEISCRHMVLSAYVNGSDQHGWNNISVPRYTVHTMRQSSKRMAELVPTSFQKSTVKTTNSAIRQHLVENGR